MDLTSSRRAAAFTVASWTLLFTSATLATAAPATAPAASATKTAANAAATASLTVHVDQPGHAISPTLYGIFFEEINHSGDGGIYAELVNNRSFEDAATPEHWTVARSDGAAGAIDVAARPSPGTYNKSALKLTIADPAGGFVGASNEGYWGIAVKAGETYDLALSAQAADGLTGPLTARLEGADGKLLAEATLPAPTSAWGRKTAALVSSGTDPAAHLVIRAASKGTLWLDDVSLFPRATFMNRPNGMRVDLMQKLVDMGPSFVRFPGGCWVEGDTMATSYRWKQTIGDVTDRRTNYNLWQYMSSNGLGYHEYLQLCEDLGAAPLFVINVGMSHRETVPMDQMGPYVQDALDAIEYANGPTTSTWGALRAANGHPAPFNLKYMEIGNENGGASYAARWPLFYNAIKAKYPQMQLVADVWGGGAPTSPTPDLVDEHYYSNPGFFIQNANKYDTYDRKGPKVYVGEYAVTQGCGQGNVAAAIGEAAFMTGMERNSDIVTLASYAPLFANVNYKKWNPDTINFDSSRSYGTPSYYVQQMFAKNKGDVVLPVDLDAAVITPASSLSGGVGLSTWRTQAEFKDVEVRQGDKVLWAWSFGKGQGPWKATSGQWAVKDGAFQQTGSGDDFRATAGPRDWTDYTYTLKARKLGDNEGFLIMFRVHDNDNYLWWNIGGWGNTRHAIQQSIAGGVSELPGSSVNGSVNTGQWYDIKVDVSGQRVRCYLDGQLIHDVTIPQQRALYATASYAKATGETLLKVVNVTDTDCDAALTLGGAATVAPAGTAIVLSGNPADENTLDQPVKIAPVTKTLSGVSSQFHQTFPAHSLTVLRLKAAP